MTRDQTPKPDVASQSPTATHKTAPPAIALPGKALRVAACAYSLLWRTMRPILRRNARLADGFAERLVPADWMQERADMWIQAASGGEAKLAVALAHAIDAALRQTQSTSSISLCVLATTWTRQGYDMLEQGRVMLEEAGSPVRMLVRFVPFDDPVLMERAVEQARPGMLVLLETELWPGLLLACARRRVPVLFANARMREDTAKRYAWAASLWRSLAPAQVCAMAAADADRFTRVFPGVPCTLIPNIKFDLAIPPSGSMSTETEAPLSACLPMDQQPRVLLASVREEEEACLVQALGERMRAQSGACLFGRAARLIIAPRHLHRVSAWQEHLRGLGFVPCLRSQLEHSPCPADAPIIWDVFGELASLYANADAVFVGGSLAPLGGQNFLEPLAAGLVPCVGPDTSNFDWTLDEGPESSPGLETRGLLHRVHDASSVLDALAAAVAKPLLPSDRQRVRADFSAWLAPRQGGTMRTAAVALRLLAGSPHFI